MFRESKRYRPSPKRKKLGLRDINIQSRLVVAFLLLSIVPLLIVGFFAYNTYTNSINRKLSDYMVQSLALIDKNIAKELEKCEYLCGQVTVLPIVQQNLSRYAELDYNQQREITLSINEIFAQHVTLTNYIKSIYIFTDAGEPFYAFGFDSLIKGTADYLMGQIRDSAPKDYWTHITTQRGAKSLVLGRKINSLNNYYTCIGYVFVVINERQFTRRTYSEVSLGEGSQLFIVDDDGLILSSSSEHLITGTLFPDKKLMKAIKESEETFGHFNIRLDDEEKLVGFYKNPYTRWYTVTTIPFSYINSETSRLNLTLLAMGIGCILLSLFLLAFIISSIVLPIRRLVSYANMVSKGTLDIHIGDEYNDEIGKLSTAFDNMVKKITELIAEDRLKEQRQRKLELDVLRYQINPHFLFNTLDSLKIVAALSRVTTVSNGLAALSELLRNTIVKDNQFFTLKEEIENVKNYLLIQRIRYGGTFSVSYHIQEELLNAKILRLLLQPIVENSIIHGVSGTDSHVNISIQARRRGDMMIINISDDGSGFDAKNPKTRSSDRMTGIGLDNVRERIKLRFGEPYGLNIESEIGKGTRCTLMLPVEFDEGVK